uniref:p78/83 n=1 Tax=Cnaphalocrocis medinalis granulovirus TaxID=1750712 RepID=A0A0X9IIB1_9BBAC|nr:p78/83 [Cnaphalocrocis medinalis granulovirus]
MDLFMFMKEANFKTNARETLLRMKWNTSLKNKLLSLHKNINVDDDNNDDDDDNKSQTLDLTIDETIEFLESVYIMMIKILKSTSSTCQKQQQPPPSLLVGNVLPIQTSVTQSSSLHPNATPTIIQQQQTTNVTSPPPAAASIKLVCGGDDKIIDTN